MTQPPTARLHRLTNPAETTDAADWTSATFYRLERPGDSAGALEHGAVAFGWTPEALVARFEMTDSSIVTSATRDNELHYELGDTAELFIKHADHDGYWEFYATPNGYRTAMFWEVSPRDHEPDAIPFIDPEAVEVRVGRHEIGGPSWWAEISVSRRLLGSRDGRFEVHNGTWSVLAGRYNYGVGRTDRAEPRDPEPVGTLKRRHLELTSFPRLPRADFHMLQHFAELREDA
ncbi:MAG: hypothetical protein AAF710_11830 [Planctomycetota bacterium]